MQKILWRYAINCAYAAYFQVRPSYQLGTPGICLMWALFAPLDSHAGPCNQCSIVARGIERWEHRGSQYLIKQWRNTILPQRHNVSMCAGTHTQTHTQTHTHVSDLSCKGHTKEKSRPSVILHCIEKGQWLVVSRCKCVYICVCVCACKQKGGKRRKTPAS